MTITSCYNRPLLPATRADFCSAPTEAVDFASDSRTALQHGCSRCTGRRRRHQARPQVPLRGVLCAQSALVVRRPFRRRWAVFDAFLCVSDVVGWTTAPLTAPPDLLAVPGTALDPMWSEIGNRWPSNAGGMFAGCCMHQLCPIDFCSRHRSTLNDPENITGAIALTTW